MNDLYAETLLEMQGYFGRLEKLLDKPKLAWFNGGYVYRYEKQSVYAAIIQKLSRVVTGLHAVYLLNDNGLVQEQAVLHRVLDELTEDISFLSYAIIFDDFTALHQKYLTAFYEEEHEPDLSSPELPKNRPTVSRKKIRAYINKFGDDPSTGVKVSHFIFRRYSGYVHCASPQIMELYYGNPPKFHLRENKNSPFYQDHSDDLLNYFYRGIQAFAFAAKAYGNTDLFNEIYDYSQNFARKSGNARQLTP